MSFCSIANNVHNSSFVRTEATLLPATAMLVVLAAAAGGIAVVRGQRTGDNKVTTLLGGPDVLNILRAPEKVEAYRFVRLASGEDPNSQATIGGAGVVSGPVGD